MNNSLKSAFIFFLFIFSATAEETMSPADHERQKRKFPTVRQEDFKPYMLGHIHEGCPSNSTCSKKTGAKRKKWIDVLKASPLDQRKTARGLERFRSQYGLPIGFWLHTEKIEKDEPDHKLIIWDSHCSNHQSKNSKERIFLGESMIKSFKDFDKMNLSEHKIMLNKTWTLTKKGKLLSYFHPRAEFPIKIDSGGIYITREAEGKYYGLQIDNRGAIRIIPVSNPKSFPKEVVCPEKLVQSFKTEVEMANLYMGHYCKAIWNDTTKEYQTFIFGWSCN